MFLCFDCLNSTSVLLLSVDVLFAIGACDGESNMKRERMNLRDFTQRRSSIMRTILPVPGNDDVRQNGSCDFIDVHAKKNKQYCRYGTAFSAR